MQELRVLPSALSKFDSRMLTIIIIIIISSAMSSMQCGTVHAKFPWYS